MPMTTPSWNVSGQYYETCNCDFVCPCVPGQLAVRPTKGDCQFAMAFQIERGSFGAVPLDGLGFIILGRTPEAMGKGNWSVGVIADERASVEQREAMTAIASGLSKNASVTELTTSPRIIGSRKNLSGIPLLPTT